MVRLKQMIMICVGILIPIAAGVGTFFLLKTVHPVPPADSIVCGAFNIDMPGETCTDPYVTERKLQGFVEPAAAGVVIAGLEILLVRRRRHAASRHH